jgi:hypothetical protein
MAELARLFTRGLRWSHRRYGLKGAIGFFLLIGIGYYVLDRNLDEPLEEKVTGLASDNATGPGVDTGRHTGTTDVGGVDRSGSNE